MNGIENYLKLSDLCLSYLSVSKPTDFLILSTFFPLKFFNTFITFYSILKISIGANFRGKVKNILSVFY